MPQCTCIVLNPIYFAGWVTNQLRLIFFYGQQFFSREKALVGQNCVKRLNRVPLALDVPIVLWRTKILRRNVHDLVVKDVEDVNTGETSASMPGVRGLDDAQYRPTIPN